MDYLRIIEITLLIIASITGYLLIRSQKKQLEAQANLFETEAKRGQAEIDKLITETINNLIPPLNKRIDELEEAISKRDEKINELEKCIEDWKRKFNELEKKYLELSQRKLL